MAALVGATITEYRYDMDGRLLNFDAHEACFDDVITINALTVASYQPRRTGFDVGCLITFVGGHTVMITESYDEVRRILRFG